MSPHGLTRRQFLALLAAGGAVAVPGLLGYDLLGKAGGEAPPHLSPYAPTGILEAWPAGPAEAAPLLVLVSEGAANPFGAYLAEILRAEGLNACQVGRLADLVDAPLPWYDTVILAEAPLNEGQAGQLSDYVAQGGNLVAMRPAARLAPLVGLRPSGAELADAYLQVEPTHPVAQGIATRPLQYHGAAGLYALDGAEPIAWLRGGAEGAEPFPAVAVQRAGKGYAAMWAFDLARSVAYTRQGNPAWANQERDGGLGIRAADMFQGWLDLEAFAVPQADEQQRLLANLLGALSQGRRPLPRLWYFPGQAQSLLVATGDAHMAPTAAIADVVERVERRGGHISLYYTPPLEARTRRAASRARFLVSGLPLIGAGVGRRFSSVDPGTIRSWRARGHEFTLHPYVGQSGPCARYLDGVLATPSLEEAWRRYWQEFTGLGYGPLSPTTRTHCVLWTGWVESARLQASFGLRMNLDYYHWGPAFRKASGEWAQGQLIGSGRPMRFVDEAGRLLAIYQQPTQLADDHLLKARFAGQPWGFAGLSAEEALAASRLLLQSGAQDHCAIGANFHPDLFAVGPAAADEETYATAVRYLEGTLDHAAELGTPIWAAQDWLAFSEERAGADVSAVQWDAAAKRLTFTLRASPGAAESLTLLIPWVHQEGNLAAVTIGGDVAVHQSIVIGAVRYGVVAVRGQAQEVVASYV